MDVPHEQTQRDLDGKSAKTMTCPVCKGAGVIRLATAEALRWNERPILRPEHRPGFVDQPCWACDGDARLPVVDYVPRVPTS
jgi:hypothetical protein